MSKCSLNYQDFVCGNEQGCWCSGNSCRPKPYPCCCMGPTGPTGPTGTILGSYDTLEALQAAHPTGNQGDAYLVGGELYIWNVTNQAWERVGSLQGPTGPTGPAGTILGSYDTLEALQTAHPTGNQGDAYLVGGELYVWNVTNQAWERVGNLQGPTGPAGATCANL